jgi:hypothetical protein
MNAKIKVVKVTYPDIKLKKSDAAKLRGFYANNNSANDIMHNHTPEGESLYRYPSVQYKTIAGKPVIIAWGDGIKPIYDEVMQVDTITIDGREIPVTDIDIKLSEPVIGDTIKIMEYSFLNPWLCLNKENYKKYLEADEEQKKELLIRILVGNTLSFAKAFGIKIENRLKAEIDLKEIKVNFKNEPMIAFYGTFKINFQFPDYFGIGKSGLGHLYGQNKKMIRGIIKELK